MQEGGQEAHWETEAGAEIEGEGRGACLMMSVNIWVQLKLQLSVPLQSMSLCFRKPACNQQDTEYHFPISEMTTIYPGRLEFIPRSV